MRIKNYNNVNTKNAVKFAEFQHSEKYPKSNRPALIETFKVNKEVIYRTEKGWWFEEKTLREFNRATYNNNTGWGNPYVEIEITPLYGEWLGRYLDDSKQEYVIAVHEAAHFLAELYEGRKPRYVTLNPTEDIRAGVKLGRSLSEKEMENLSVSGTLSRIFSILAGPLAENEIAKFYKVPKDALWSEGAGNDKFAIDSYLKYWAPVRRGVLLELAFRNTERWVKNNIHKIEFLAKKLTEHKKLTREEIEELIST